MKIFLCSSLAVAMFGFVITVGYAIFTGSVYAWIGAVVFAGLWFRIPYVIHKKYPNA